MAETTKEVTAKLRKIEGVEVLGNPVLCLFAFNIKDVTVYEVCHIMSKNNGWNISPLHLPKAGHICITPANVENVRKNFVNDFKEALKEVRSRPVKKDKSDNAAIYGASADMPSVDLNEEMMRTALRVSFS